MHLRIAPTAALAACALVGAALAETTLSYTRGQESTACRADGQGQVVCITTVDGAAPPHPGMRPVPAWPPHPGLPMEPPIVPTLPGQDDLLVPPFAGTGGGSDGPLPNGHIPPSLDPAMPDATPDTADTHSTDCALERAKALVGMAWDDSLLEGIGAPDAVRVLGPHDAATMDYSPSRLNILLDDAGKVFDVRCG